MNIYSSCKRTVLVKEIQLNENLTNFQSIVLATSNSLIMLTGLLIFNGTLIFTPEEVTFFVFLCILISGLLILAYFHEHQRKQAFTGSAIYFVFLIPFIMRSKGPTLLINPFTILILFGCNLVLIPLIGHFFSFES